MSTNTDPGQKDRSQGQEKKSEFAFVREKLGLYIAIGLVLLVLGKTVSKGMGQELWNQSIRNAISGVAVVALFIAGLANAHILFLILLLYIPFVDAIPGRFGGQYTALNLFNVLSVIMIVCWFVDTVKKRRPFFVVNSATKIAMAYLALSFISYAVNGFEYGTPYLLEQVFNLKRWIDPLLLFFIASGLMFRRDLRKDAVIALMLGVAMSIFIAIKDVGQISHFSNERRIAGMGDQPNMFGAFVVDYMYLFAGILLVNHRKKLYWLALIPIIWGIRAVTVSFSRGAYAGFIIATVVIALIRSRILFIIVITVFVFIACNLWVLPTAVQERIEMTVKGEQVYGYGVEVESSASSRIDAWNTVFEMIKTKPIFGYGIGLVGTYLAYYSGVRIGDVHNSYLLMAAEYGVPLLIIFLMGLCIGIRSSWYVYKRSSDPIFQGAALGFIAGIVGLSVNCFFGSHMTTLWEIGYFWVLLALFASEEKQLKDEAALSVRI